MRVVYEVMRVVYEVMRVVYEVMRVVYEVVRGCSGALRASWEVINQSKGALIILNLRYVQTET